MNPGWACLLLLISVAAAKTIPQCFEKMHEETELRRCDKPACQIPQSKNLTLNIEQLYYKEKQSTVKNKIDIGSNFTGELCMKGDASIPKGLMGPDDTFDVEISVGLVMMGKLMPLPSISMIETLLARVPVEYDWIGQLFKDHLHETHARIEDICGLLKSLFSDARWAPLLQRLQDDPNVSEEDKKTTLDILRNQADLDNPCVLDEWAGRLALDKCTDMALPALSSDLGGLSGVIPEQGMKMQVYPQITVRNKQSGDEYLPVCLVIPFLIHK